MRSELSFRISVPPRTSIRFITLEKTEQIRVTKTWADHLTGLVFGQQFVCGMMDWFMFQNKKYNLSKIWVKMLNFKRDTSERFPQYTRTSNSWSKF
jgi:hypothetical protein